MSTYRVKNTSSCRQCSYPQHCIRDGIPESQVYKYLNNDKLYAHIGDGHECYSSEEVEIENQADERERDETQA